MRQFRLALGFLAGALVVGCGGPMTTTPMTGKTVPTRPTAQQQPTTQAGSSPGEPAPPAVPPSRRIWLDRPQVTSGSEKDKYNVTVNGWIEVLEGDSTPGIKAWVGSPPAGLAYGWMANGRPTPGQPAPIRFTWTNLDPSTTKYEGDAELLVDTTAGGKWVRTNVEFTIRP